MPPKGKKAAGQISPSKQVTSTGFPQRQAETVLSNFDLECSSRRIELQRNMESLLADLKRRTESEYDKLPSSVYAILVKDFFNLYDGDVRAAAEGVVSEQVKQQAKIDQESTESQSPKKRKRPAESPSVPPSPALPRAKRFQPLPSSTSKPSATLASKKTTTKRKPKKNETVQAYSLNGSPLAIPALPVSSIAESSSGSSGSSGRGTVPSGEFTFQLTLDSLAKGLREELSKTEMSAGERQKLEERLLSFMQSFKA